jgi:hypothetical protein
MENKETKTEEKEQPVVIDESMQKDLSLRQMMDLMVKNQNLLIDQKKTKKFKLPIRATMWLPLMKRKKGYCLIIYCQDNRNIQFMKLPIDQATVMIKNSPHIASARYMMTYKNMPVLFIPAWNIEPFDPTVNINEAEREKTLSVGRRLLLNRMKEEVIKSKKTINWFIVIGAIIAVGAIGYFLTKGGGGLKLF